MKKVLIGGPIHQEPEILDLYLKSLEALNQDKIEVHYCFVDDNRDEESSKILKEFKERHTVKILKSYSKDKYEKTEHTHIWKEQLIWKVADFKNRVILEAKKGKYDYLLFVDSDLILHPNTLQHLIKTGKDIISEVFWTKWAPESMPLPQVWLKDEYTMYHKDRGEEVTQQELEGRMRNFLNMLRRPGVYEVGGLGALTLISKRSIDAGVNFSEIKNVSFWGEDRHFCIRAQALGLKLHADTHYPAFHIYRQSDLEILKAQSHH
ncbi:glycosyltransferase family 2 protein [Priestia filamentosa]|uniref:glycosyltransferase n=1 Tax=Priestia filamentosa TaxID=1402861 RepID=UPI00058967B6